MPEKYDMAVLGGGPGGYVAALRGRQLGLSVLLAEKEKVGGVCLNRGCIPTKTLLADAEGLRWASRWEKEGLVDRKPRLLFEGIRKRKEAVVSRLGTNLEKLLSAAGVTLVKDSSRIIEPGAIALSGDRIVRASNIVVATGSRPWVPSIPGVSLHGVMGTRQILQMDSLPGSLVIIGGGVIGQEFASIYAAIGSSVTVLEFLDRIMYEVDEEISRRYSNLLPSLGIASETGVRVTAIEQARNDLRVVYEKGAKEKSLNADMVLFATGRKPYLDGTGVIEQEVVVRNGSIVVDKFLETSVKGIYAAGDVTGRRMLAHVASYHGEVVAENISGHTRAVDDKVVPYCVFSIPQLAWVGITEQQAREAGTPYRTSSFPLTASGKALAVGESRGLVKLIEDVATGRLVGAHFLGAGVSELIGEATLAIRMGMSASDIVQTIHAHPTISEAFREAALGFFEGPLHSAPRLRSFG